MAYNRGIDSLNARSSAYMHYYRKIGGGRAYQEGTIDKNPDPMEGYEHYHTEPLFEGRDIHLFVVEFQELLLTEMLGEEAGAFGPPCDVCKGVGEFGTPGQTCFQCKGKGYPNKPNDLSSFVARAMALVDKHGSWRWETGFNEASPIATSAGDTAGRQAITARRMIELFLQSEFVKGLFK